LQGIDFPTSPDVLIGLDTADDAGVYRISPELALIQTVDFLTPMVDDPYDFGSIAAANALSDVYAMGGAPKMAMNIVAFPMIKLGVAVLRAVLAGGAAKLREAGAVLLGGHSVEDDEMKFGMAVTGFVHPAKILANQGLSPGDRLILTKKLGTGVISTAIKAGLAEAATVRAVTEQMAALNKTAAEILPAFAVSACTDVTGFGFLGHLCEMIAGTGREVVVDSAAVPMFAEAREFAAIGLVPAAARHNRQFREKMVALPPSFDPIVRDILFDPQTSGGLLLGCAEKTAEQLCHRLNQAGVMAAIVGWASDGGEEKVVVR
jgi:selenide,water dikinase